MNVRDSEVIAGLLKANSYELTAKAEEADIIIFNTCSVRQHAEEKVWSEIGRIAKLSTRVAPPRFLARNARNLSRGDARPMKKIIGLAGCMAQEYKDEVFRRAPAVDFVVGPSDIAKIPGIIKSLTHDGLLERKIWETDSSLRPEEIYHTGFYQDKEHAYVVISEGCSNYCSYCVVPYARGELHNRDGQDILKEIEEAVVKGITKITLLGQNVNAYSSGAPSHSASPAGRQATKSPVEFVRLLKMVNEIKGLEEFSFVTSHPRDTSEELFRVMQECDKLKKYLHLPVQSGSDRILELMGRGYTRKFYLDLVDSYRRIVKDGVLTTDIIVGFPGEKEADFQDTYNLVKDTRFDAAYIFKYSPRPNTAAAKLEDDVEKKEKERRHSLILELQKKISKQKNG